MIGSVILDGNDGVLKKIVHYFDSRATFYESSFQTFLFNLECYIFSMKQAIEIGYENNGQVPSTRVFDGLEHDESIMLAAKVLSNTWW